MKGERLDLDGQINQKLYKYKKKKYFLGWHL